MIKMNKLHTNILFSLGITEIISLPQISVLRGVFLANHGQVLTTKPKLTHEHIRILKFNKISLIRDDTNIHSRKS